LRPRHRKRPHRSVPGSPVIVLLGTDGAGKTTTAAALAAREWAAGRPALVLRNRSCRRWLIRTAERLQWEVPVGWADRIETLVRTANVLVAHARAGRRDRLVVMDRHLVCQLVLRELRGLPAGPWLPALSDRLLRSVTVAVLDVPAQTAFERIRVRGEDDESLAYLQAARAAYLELARTRGWLVVDASGPTEDVLEQMEQLLVATAPQTGRRRAAAQ
jgi:dTMP kinase